MMILWRSIFSLRLLDRVADHAYCHNYPVLTRPGNCSTCSVFQIMSCFKDSSMKWMNLNCVAPAFPLGPKHSQLTRADRIQSQDFLSCSLVHEPLCYGGQLILWLLIALTL